MMFLKLCVERTPEEDQQILELRELVDNCEELNIGTDDVLLTKFLNYTNWNVEKAFAAINKYYDFKHQYPKWVAQHPVSYYREQFLETPTKFIMPNADKEGRVLVVFKTIDAFDKFPDYLQDIIEMDDLIFESLLMMPRVQKYGITVICDLCGTTKNFLRMLSPSFARVVNHKHDVLPFKKRCMHIIQRGFFLNATSSLIWPFMSKEFKAQVFMHDGKNYNKLRDMVGYDYLPADYGGPKENILDANLLYDHLLQNADYLEKLQTYKKKVIA